MPIRLAPRGSGARAARLLLVVLACFACGESAASNAYAWRDEPLSLRLEGGRAVAARVRVPMPDAGPLQPAMPAVMLLGGFERGAAALDLVQPTRPTILASFDYPIVMPERLGPRESIAVLPEARRAVHDSLQAVGLLYAQLARRADVDAARTTLVGVSFGAPFAVVGAAEHAVPGLVVIHGFADLPQVIGHQFASRWARDGRAWMWPLAWLLGHALDAYARLPDIEQQAARLRATQQVWMLSARDDARVPAAATESLRAAFARSAARLRHDTEDGGHLRGQSDPRIPRLLRRTEAWLIANGL